MPRLNVFSRRGSRISDGGAFIWFGHGESFPRQAVTRTTGYAGLNPRPGFSSTLTTRFAPTTCEPVTGVVGMGFLATKSWSMVRSCSGPQ